MPVLSPAVPTRLPEVDVSGKARRNVGVAVVAHAEQEADSPRLGPGAQRIPVNFPKAAGATGKTGELLLVPLEGGQPCWLIGVGSGTVGNWRSAGAVLARGVEARASVDESAGRRVTRSVQLELPEGTGAAQVAALTTGLMLGGYGFTVGERDSAPKVRSVHLVTAVPERLADAVARAAVLARATALSRDLANTPSNIKDPAWLARTAERVLEGRTGLRTTVRDERWLAEQGFGGILAVGGGSARPPRLIEMSWRPPAAVLAGIDTRDTPHLVFVGKGITFDTGGISIKPNAGMHLMRTDMAGGGSVIAAMRAIAELGVPLRVSGLVPTAENHVSGSAYRPGDIVRHYGGQTTEVVNTDAEGRLVLADALVYATRRLSAGVLVDVATLTGAMKVALGLYTGGLFANSDELAGQIAATGELVGEAWWRMPLSDDTAAGEGNREEIVVSDIADVRQAPDGPAAGITAALFLREFVGDLPWAHLDIAGPARAEKAHDEVVAGATGFAARTLVELAASMAPCARQ